MNRFDKQATVQLPFAWSVALGVDHRMLTLSPGMVASVEIKTGSRTMMACVLAPMMKATCEIARER